MKFRVALAALAGLGLVSITPIASAQPVHAPSIVTPVYYGGYYGYRPAPRPYYYRHWHHGWRYGPRYGYYRYGYPYRY